MNVALAGNPNCGKTTLFNILTGSRCEVGNFAGVTVERRRGICSYNGIKFHITDLPGIYSLSPNSAEEIIARDFIVNEKPDIILNITDATNLRRNLYLTTQLAQTGTPVLMALNMTDALEENGLSIDTKILEEKLGIRIIPISANKETGINELLTAMSEKIYPCNKAFKNDDERYRFINNAVSSAVFTVGKNKQAERTERIDSIVSHPIFALPLFLTVMLFVFWVTFGSFGGALSDFADNIFNVKFASIINALLCKLGVGIFIKGLIIDGIIAGVGGVVKFSPQIMLLFLFLAFLEDSGYMARTAFITDSFFSRLGLGGKSFLPLLTGFGCSVPAAMAVRTLENERDRRLTLLLIPFMSCSAKLPVYTIFAAALFPDKAWLVIFSLYITGILIGAVSGLIFSKTVLKGQNPPFVLELPPYRMPSLKSVFRHMSEKAKDFAVRAGTVLLLVSIIIWLFENLNFNLRIVSDSRNSILGVLGNIIAPVFKPCGFGTPEAAISLLSGVAAKEAIVSTLTILAHKDPICAVSAHFSPLGGYCFLVFVLLYVPCAASLAALRTELNSRRLLAFSVCWQLFAAWCVSALIYQSASLFL